MAKRNDRPTLATVAVRAGVSIKTASRVLNGEKHVAESTAQKVEAAAAELGFRLNSTARRLRAGSRPPFVGVVLSDVDEPFQSRFLSCLETELARVNLRPVIGVTSDDPDREREFLDECLDADLAGICIIRAQPETADLYSKFASSIPIVSIDPETGHDPIPVIAPAEREAGRLAASQLLSHGHISIGVIGDRASSVITALRLEGVRDALNERAGVGWRAYLQEEVHDQSTAKNVVAALLGSRSAPSALICLSPIVTRGAIDASRRLDQWPALVGIGDFAGADLQDLTVIDADLSLMAAEVVRRFDATSGSGSGGAPVEVTVPLTVIERGSGEESPEHSTVTRK